jgi:hypothetical protein
MINRVANEASKQAGLEAANDQGRIYESSAEIRASYNSPSTNTQRKLQGLIDTLWGSLLHDYDAFDEKIARVCPTLILAMMGTSDCGSERFA